MEFAKHADIVRGHTKWEGRIYKVLRQNLESDLVLVFWIFLDDWLVWFGFGLVLLFG